MLGLSGVSGFFSLFGFAGISGLAHFVEVRHCRCANPARLHNSRQTLVARQRPTPANDGIPSSVPGELDPV